jgi:hypothetical protein
VGKIKKGILLIFILFLVIVGINFYHFFIMPNDYEVLHILLEDSQNKMLNTTEEKNGCIPYQILDGNLYYEEDGFYQYNYNKRKKKKLWGGEIGDFKILRGKVYYAKWNNSKSDYNVWNVECRNLENLNKEQLIEGVSDYVFSGEFVFFSRIVGGKRYIYQYDIKSANCNEIFSFDEFDQKREFVAGDMILVLGNNLIFEGNGRKYITSYNINTNKWSISFNFSFQEQQLYFRILDIQAKGDFLYVQGTVCDNTKSNIAGPYVVKDAEKNGIWQVDINTGKQKHLTKTVYYGGIYILDNILYGIDNGKYEKIGRN